jgi:hypothetical protein
MEKCRHCGSSINAGFMICPHCRGDQRPSDSETLGGCFRMMVIGTAMAIVVIIGFQALFPDAQDPDHNQPIAFDVGGHLTGSYGDTFETASYMRTFNERDVYFHIDRAPKEHRQAVADYIIKHRPELSDRVAWALAESIETE